MCGYIGEETVGKRTRERQDLEFGSISFDRNSVTRSCRAGLDMLKLGTPVSGGSSSLRLMAATPAVEANGIEPELQSHTPEPAGQLLPHGVATTVLPPSVATRAVRWRTMVNSERLEFGCDVGV